MRALTRRPSLIFICLVALTQAAYSRSGDQKPRPSGLYQVRMWEEKSGGYRIGFIDNTGRLVIGFDRLPKTANYVGEFHEGRAVIQLDESGGGRVSQRVGYIDETGAVVIEPRFTSARDALLRADQESPLGWRQQKNRDGDHARISPAQRLQTLRLEHGNARDGSRCRGRSVEG